MREILFRGKRADNGEWVEGYYVRLYGGNGRVSRRIYTSFAEVDCGNYYPDFFEVQSSTVGQYTGLKDKNGKMIFEGDIVDASEAWWDAYGPAGHDSPIMLVEWSESFCGFEPFANYDCDCGVYIAENECKVIGNIHDNPELLNPEKYDPDEGGDYETL